MEKQRADRFAYRRIRLLIYRMLFAIAGAIIFCGSVFAQNFGDSDRQLFMLPETETVFTGEEILFSVFVPDIVSSNVQISSPNFGEGVDFLVLRSLDYFVQGRRGVRVELLLSFAHAGYFALPPLVMMSKGLRQEIPFANFYVSQKNYNVQPTMLITFERAQDGMILSKISSEQNYAREIFSVETGTAISVKVNFQNAKKIERLSWSLPEHSLFSLVEQNADNSIFEWIVLSSGSEAIPAFTAVAVANDGSVVELYSPAAAVNVTAAAVGEKVTGVISGIDDSTYEFVGENYFTHAFESASLDSVKEILSQKQMTLDECEQLALSLLQEKKYYKYATMFFAIVAIVAALIFVLCLVKKKKLATIIVTIVFVVACLGFVFCGIKITTRKGVFLGGNVSSIPENVSGQVVFVDAGQIVHITQSVGGWHYITCDVASGWVLVDKVLEK